MPEILIRPEPFLKPRQYVYFTSSWNIERVAGKFFEVVRTQQLTYEKAIILQENNYYTFTMNEDSGLLPDRTNTLYEMYIGIKGNVLMYIRWPSTDYFMRFEKAELKPAEPERLSTDVDKRYISVIDQTISPYDKPRYREYTIKEMEPIALVFFNDSIDDEKVVLRFLVNRCMLVETEEKPEKFRIIPFYTDFKW